MSPPIFFLVGDLSENLLESLAPSANLICVDSIMWRAAERLRNGDIPGAIAELGFTGSADELAIHLRDSCGELGESPTVEQCTELLRGCSDWFPEPAAAILPGLLLRMEAHAVRPQVVTGVSPDTAIAFRGMICNTAVVEVRRRHPWLWSRPQPRAVAGSFVVTLKRARDPRRLSDQFWHRLRAEIELRGGMAWRRDTMSLEEVLRGHRDATAGTVAAAAAVLAAVAPRYNDADAPPHYDVLPPGGAPPPPVAAAAPPSYDDATLPAVGICAPPVSTCTAAFARAGVAVPSEPPGYGALWSIVV
jgi:hypothetical protein